MRILITILVALLTFSLFGQSATSSESKDEHDVYFQALKHYLSEESKDIVYVELNNITSEGLPTDIAGTEVILLPEKKVLQMAKKKEFVLHRIIPLRFEKSNFFVNVIPYEVECKRKNLELKNLGGMQVDFRFNCESEQFDIISN